MSEEPVASAPLKEERTLREVLDTALRYIAGFEGRNELAVGPHMLCSSLAEVTGALKTTCDRLGDCEQSLTQWDEGQDSEYWLRHPNCVRYQLLTSRGAEQK